MNKSLEMCFFLPSCFCRMTCVRSFFTGTKSQSEYILTQCVLNRRYMKDLHSRMWFAKLSLADDFCVPWRQVGPCKEHMFVHGNLSGPPQMPPPPQEIAGLIRGLWKPIGFPPYFLGGEWSWVGPLRLPWFGSIQWIWMFASVQLPIPSCKLT